MVLLNDVVEVLHLPNNYRNSAAGLDLINGRFVGAALVHSDLRRNTVGLHGFVKEAHGCGLVALGRQQEVDCLALLVYRAVEILPDAFDLYVRLVHAPAPSHWAQCLRRTFSSNGRNQIAQRLIEEWSTNTLALASFPRDGDSSTDTPRTNGCTPESRRLGIAFLWCTASRFNPFQSKPSA